MFQTHIENGPGRRLIVTILVVLWLVNNLSGCHSANPRYPSKMETAALDIPLEQQTGNDVFESYTIDPGDVLAVLFQFRTWDEEETYTISVNDKVAVNFIHAPELNQEQDVLPDGKISLPYIGQVKVSGATVEELTARLEEKYSAVLRNPQLYIVVSETRRRIQEFKNDIRSDRQGLNRLLTVRPDGITSFPYLGEMRVAGRTMTSVTLELNQKYELFMRGLNVNLSLQEAAGSLIYILGEVNQPGGYKILRPVTALEAISLAGGYKSSAKLEEVVAIRRLAEQVTARRIDLVNAITLADQQYFLQPDDVLFVPKSTLFANAEIVQQVADVLLFRGWGISFSWDNLTVGN
jgi:polysaccharide export outer membrane protein